MTSTGSRLAEPFDDEDEVVGDMHVGQDHLVALGSGQDMALPERSTFDPRRIGRDQPDGASRVPVVGLDAHPADRKSIE